MPCRRGVVLTMLLQCASNSTEPGRALAATLRMLPGAKADNAESRRDSRYSMQFQYCRLGNVWNARAESISGRTLGHSI
ncbi:hypothetical protein BS47DRAFT_1355372 [Hydnum rufescens UP504]|uniref:Uncharacterized protein n=1 Tax=Hydnum rufescens UP504 TaxID=1448309 RepID=A0A9P6AFC0_9AGAM|nr:hypothetical protein BS47DRAFT_1355372 [Hydnum rufescens UP504]